MRASRALSHVKLTSSHTLNDLMNSFKMFLMISSPSGSKGNEKLDFSVFYFPLPPSLFVSVTVTAPGMGASGPSAAAFLKLVGTLQDCYSSPSSVLDLGTWFGLTWTPVSGGCKPAEGLPSKALPWNQLPPFTVNSVGSGSMAPGSSRFKGFRPLGTSRGLWTPHQNLMLQSSLSQSPLREVLPRVLRDSSCLGSGFSHYSSLSHA